LRERATEGQIPQGGKTDELPLASQGTTSPPVGQLNQECRGEHFSPSAHPTAHGSLPAAYGEDYIVLLARDPSWLFAYWEITPTAWSRAKGELRDDECRTVLRVYLLDPDAKCPQAYFDITVQPFSQSWYIPTGKRGGSYQAGIGIRTPDGSYLEISRSNIITAPRGSLSQLIDERWLTIEEAHWVSQHRLPGTSPMEWHRQRRGRIAALAVYPTSPGLFSPMGEPRQNRQSESQPTQS